MGYSSTWGGGLRGCDIIYGYFFLEKGGIIGISCLYIYIYIYLYI